MSSSLLVEGGRDAQLGCSRKTTAQRRGVPGSLCTKSHQETGLCLGKDRGHRKDTKEAVIPNLSLLEDIQGTLDKEGGSSMF